ncbi:MAG TPA: hypothetical protein VFQ53_16790 [Kofleriaceae bacterium]|nr:hypothetical protein [Kofleriaceae bacterium]
MKSLVLPLMLLAGAAGCMDAADDSYPVVPSETPDPGAGGGTGGDGSMLSGRVCVTVDLIDRATCGESGGGGLTVSLGGATTTTAADGSFTLPRPTGSFLSYTVGGPGMVTTTTPYSPSPTVPVISADTWASVLASNDITLPAGIGSILGTLVRGGSPASGMSVTSTPASAFRPFYDGPAGFVPGGTGLRGVFLVPGVTAGATSLTFSPGETQVAGISVVNGGVTILDSMALP